MNHSEIVQIESFDNYIITGKLSVPDRRQIDDYNKLVIYVNGSGPNTYDNRRKLADMEFNYYDVFADELNKRNIAFFRYNTRGVSPGNTPLLFTEINDVEYQKYLPSNSIADVQAIIEHFRGDKKFKSARILLLGWSEGTIIAPLVAKRVSVDGLLLAGYSNDKLNEIIKWQLSGHSSMIFYRRYFDLHNKGYITEEDFNVDKFGKGKTILKGVSFRDIDKNQDGKIDEQDIKANLQEYLKATFEAINNRDDEWLKNNYAVRLTSQWFLEHFSLKPNKETLLDLDLPIHIFHGVYDQSVPVEGVYDIFERFKNAGKTNLYIHTFENHDHDLNYMSYPREGVLSEGFIDIFNICEEI